MAKNHNGRNPYQSVRVGENIARELRERILSGAYAGSLPKQETLMEDFGVSAPSIREAFRVLESEGLIVVRRGNVGGALISLPSADDTGYALGLALQAEGALLSEVAASICAFDPHLASECAKRPDRMTEVIPKLQASIDRSQEMIDAEEWEYEAQPFHDLLGELCGNRAMKSVILGLYALYHSHLDEWTHEHGSVTGPEQRRQVIDEHRQMVRLIAEGDARGAEVFERAHIERWLAPLLDAQEVVSVTVPRRARRRRQATA